MGVLSTCLAVNRQQHCLPSVEGGVHIWAALSLDTCNDRVQAVHGLHQIRRSKLDFHNTLGLQHASSRSWIRIHLHLRVQKKQMSN